MLKRIISVLVAVVLCMSVLTATSFAADTGKISVSTAAGITGKTVKITVKLNSNPGIIALRLNVSYDEDKVQLVSASDGKLLGNSKATFGKSVSSNPYTLMWEDSLSKENHTETGTLVTLVFKIAGKASGTSPIIVEVDEAFDTELESVSFSVTQGKITITSDETTTKKKETTTKKVTTTKKPDSTTKKTTTTKKADSTTKKVTTTKKAVTTTKKAITTTKKAVTTTKKVTTTVEDKTTKKNEVTTKPTITADNSRTTTLEDGIVVNGTTAPGSTDLNFEDFSRQFEDETELEKVTEKSDESTEETTEKTKDRSGAKFEKYVWIVAIVAILILFIYVFRRRHSKG